MAAVAGAAPAIKPKMMKFRFRRQCADPQREKLKQELFAFNKVRRWRPSPGWAGGCGPGLGARGWSHVGPEGRERPAGARRRAGALLGGPHLIPPLPLRSLGGSGVSD